MALFSFFAFLPVSFRFFQFLPDSFSFLPFFPDSLRLGGIRAGIPLVRGQYGVSTRLVRGHYGCQVTELRVVVC